VLNLNSKGDTTICFSVIQAKFLAKEHHRADYYFDLNSNCEQQILQKNLEINMFKKMDEKSQTIMGNQGSIIKLKDEELKVAQISIKNANRATKKQKTYKVLSLLGGAVISGYLGFKYITK